MNPAAALLSGLAAIGYSVAAMVVKQASIRGVTVWQITLVTHGMMACLTFPILFWQDLSGLGWQDFFWPVVAGATALLAGILVFLSLRSGDVSVATPILGAKVIMVAALVVVLGKTSLSIDLWVAAVLAAIGVVLVAGQKVAGGHRKQHLLTALYSFLGAGVFAFTDVILEIHASTLGFWIFFPIMTTSMAILTVVFVLLLDLRHVWKIPPQAGKPLFIGALLMSLQALCMASSIGIFKAATAANVIYSSRTFLSVIAIWGLGRLFGLPEMAGKPDHLVRRFIGAMLLFAGIVFVLV